VPNSGLLSVGARNKLETINKLKTVAVIDRKLGFSPTDSKPQTLCPILKNAIIINQLKDNRNDKIH